MAQTNNQRRSDPWSEGIEKLTEAGRLNMSATSLAVAGAAALGAAAVAYLWDEQRRRELLDMTRRFGDQSMGMWQDWPKMPGRGGMGGGGVG